MSDQLVEIPEAVTALLALFKGPLSDVVFPDVSLEILEKCTESVQEYADAVAEAMKQVEAAQEALGAAQDELQLKCTKALAYARIYAEGQDELLEQLSGIQIGKSTRAPKKAAAVRTKKEAAPAVKKEASSDDEGEGAA